MDAYEYVTNQRLAELEGAIAKLQERVEYLERVVGVNADITSRDGTPLPRKIRSST